MGLQGFTAVQLMQIIGDNSVRIIPEINVGAGNGANNGITDALIGLMLRDQFKKVAPPESAENRKQRPQPNGNPVKPLPPKAPPA
jgi:uncharacterized membrane protein YqiK